MSDHRKFGRQKNVRAESRMLYERLEDRVLFDAVPDGPVDPDQLSGSGANAGDVDRFDTSTSAVDVKNVSDSSLFRQKQSSASDTVRHELVIVDESVDDFQSLVVDLQREESDGTNVHVVTIDTAKDGVEQINAILSKYSDLDAIQIVSHGSSTGLNLGNVFLTAENLSGYAADISSWGHSLNSSGDLLLLGCELASSSEGRDLLQSLQTLTGADVAASIDDTGYSARGGDWDLEYILGQTETTIAFSESVQSNWQHLLAPGPSVSISTRDQSALIGEDVQFQVRFDNTAAAGAGDVGYGPFVDLLFPANGADGQGGTNTADGLTFQNATYFGQTVSSMELTFIDIDGAPGENGTAGDTADDTGASTLGYLIHPYLTEVQNELQVLTFSGQVDGGTLGLSLNGQSTTLDLTATGGVLNAAALQTALESLSTVGAGNVVVTGGSLPGDGLKIEFVGALAQADVPDLMVDNSLLELAGSTLDPHGAFAVSSITNGNQSPQGARIWGTPGNRLVILELPFGSITPDQPELDIVVNATISQLADVYTAGDPNSELSVHARAGFRFGADELNNPAVDPPLVSDIQNTAADWVQTASIRPTLLKVETDIHADENETATGPNYPQTFDIRVSIPEGQTISDLDISDLLPDNIVFLSLDSITSSDPTTTFSTNVPSGLNSQGNPTNQTTFLGSNGYSVLDVSGPRAGQSLVVTADSITGTGANDIVIRFQAYVDEFHADSSGAATSSVIDVDGESGAGDPVSHTASAVGDWEATDTRDQSGSATDNAVSAPHTSSITTRPLAIQKDVTIVGSSNSDYVSSGDILRYEITFQISDYFSIDDLLLSDSFSDGQLFYDAVDTSAGTDYRPTFTVSDASETYVDELFNVHVGGTNSVTTESATDNFIVDQSDINFADNALETGAGTYTDGSADPTTGTTTITIDLAERLQQLGDDGILQGGHTSDGDANDTNAGAATGRIVFYTLVQQDFSDTFPSGDRSVDHDDTITNNVSVTADVVENAEDGTIDTVLGSVTDTSGTKIDVEAGVLTKTIYAVNGDTNLPEVLSLQPGDRITYRLTYTLPNSDFESLTLTDYLPLPALVVDDYNADDVGGDSWTFDSDGTFDATVGTVERGPNDTFFHSNPGSSDYFSTAHLIVDTDANSLQFDFGSYDDSSNPSTQIDLLFTLQIQDDPFADGLYLTNIARAEFGSTNQVPEPADALVKIELGQPVVNITKGVVATDDASVVLPSVGPTVNNEFQTLAYTGGTGTETFTLQLGGYTTTGALPVSSSAATIQAALSQMTSIVTGNVIGTGNVLVTGTSVSAGDIAITFVGNLAGSYVPEMVVGTTDASGIVPVTIATELQGGDAIVIGGVGSTTLFTGRITSSALAERKIDLNLDELEDGLEAGDTVRFMIVVENTGTGANGAFDVQLRDQLPPEFEYVSGSLSVVDGVGDVLSFTTVGSHPEHALFGSGILLEDPGSTGSGTGATVGGSLDSYSGFDGRNIAIITYDATLVDAVAFANDNVTYSESIENQAVLVSYAGREGAEDHTPFRNEKQRLTTSGSPTGGTYQLTFDGETTSALAWNASDHDVIAALESLSTIGSGNVVVTGAGISDSPMTIEFQGELSDQNVSLVSADASALTGTSSIATTTVQQGSYNEQQTLQPSGLISGGTFTLSFEGETTAAIAWNADAAQIQSALEALKTIPAGSVVIEGGTLASGSMNIEFTGSLTQRDVSDLVVDTASLVGGSLGVATVQQGAAMDPQDAASIVIRGGSLEKQIVSTSESHTAKGGTIETVTVGEIVRYRLKVELPGGTQSNLQILDQLPTGLAFIDDGTAVLSFISDTHGSIVSTIGAGVLSDPAVSTTATSNQDNYGSGTDVWFSLGDVVNTETDTNAEYAVVEFNAVVVNQSGIVAGATLTNTASVYVASQNVFDLTPTNDHQVRIVEPQVSTPAKTVRLGSGSYGETVTADAGDVVDFKVTFSNASTNTTSDAFDVVLLDELPDDITLDLSSIEVYIGGVLQTAGSGYTDLSSAATDTIELNIDRLNKGQSVEIRYSGTLQIAVSPNETLTNTVNVSYTSLPGEFGTTGNVTGSDLSSLNSFDTNSAATDDGTGIVYATDSGDIYGERSGQNDGASPNTYFVQDTANVYVAGAKSISKVLDRTSIDDTATSGNNLKDEAVIGEVATYTITVKLNEGTMPNAEIIDTMDPGLVFVSVTGVSTTGLNLDASVDLTNPTVSLAGRRVTWDLGTIVDSAPGDVSTTGDSDGEISITYEVVVTNRSNNQAGRTRDNGVVFRYDDDPSTAPNPRHSISTRSTGIKIIEPVITVNKTVALDTDSDGLFDDGKTGDAGDKVRYTITLQNNSTVDAFDIDFQDVLPKVGTASAILAPTVTVSDNSTTGAVSASAFELLGSDAAGWTLQLKSGTDIDLLASQESSSGSPRTITFTVEGTIASTVTPNLSVDNSASVEWESINGDYTGPSSHTAIDTERTGADGVGGLNDYVATDSDQFVVSTPVFTKHLIGTDQTETSGSNVTIGEVVTYGLYVSLPEGITPDLTVVDQLPPGLQYVSHSFVTTTAGSADASGTNLLSADFSGTITGGTPLVTGGVLAGDDVTFTFGQIQVDVNNSDSDNGFLMIVSARVVDVPTTHGYVGNQTVLVNSGTLDVSTDGKPAQSVASPVNVTVVEPSLEITKEFGPTVNTDLADAGETVTVNLTVSNTDGKSTAYEVGVTDTLNPLHYDLSTVNLGTSGTDYPADFTVSFDNSTGVLTYSGGDIAEGATVTFKVTVTLLETVIPNQTLLNTAIVTDASTLDGTVAGERNNADPDGDGSDVDTDTIRIRRNSLAGYVWDDTDNDGVKDAGESGIGNVDVRLTGTDHLGNNVSIDVQTNPDGSYLFDNLRAGTYSILQDPDSDSLPTGYLDGKDTIGTPGGDSSVNDRFLNLSLPTGTETHGTNNNFGEIQDADLSGIVYHDANNNAAFDGSETGINGVQVQLTGTDDRNQSVSVMVTTSGGGLYSFTGLRPSNASGYTITQLTEPTGYLDGKDSDGSLANADATSVNNVISSINVVPGASGTSYRFGEVIPSTLSGYVYHDSDNDGIRTDEAAGSGILNSRITLTGKDDLGNTVSLTVDTNANGYFEFSNLRPSDSTGYTLTQTSVPATYIDGKDTLGTPGGNDAANNSFSQIVVVSNTTGTENNFGELLPSSLSGTVFNDHDNDGVFETVDGETGIAGVTLRLTGIDDLGNAVDVTLQTGSDGTYEFTNLRPSEAAGYTITETQPSNYNDGQESDGSLSNGLATSNDVLSSINVSSGDAGTGYSFAERGTTISGLVYVDDDRDSSLDASEATRLGGVSIELFDLSDPLNPVSVGTTTTATDGSYSFQHLPAGNYSVVQTQPDGYGNVSSNTINLTLPLVGLSGNNFGEALYDIGDTIYFDADGNGSQSATEQGIAGVTVSLTYAGADNVFGTADDPSVVTTTTDSVGKYKFTELFVGNYRVTVTATDLPDGVTGTQETDDAAFGFPAINGQSQVSIGSTDRLDVDFGYKGTGVLGSFVWVDVDGDGLQDVGEPGLSDMTVNLTFAGQDGVFGNADDLTLSTATADDGTYHFANLPAGDFQITVDEADTDLPGSLTAVTGTESVSGTASVSLTTGETNNDIDFGFAGSLSVGNQIWLDTDGNQSQNGNEQGLPDVTVTLVWLGQDGVVGGEDDFTLTTKTDSNGQYSFSGLPDGSYLVSYAVADLPVGMSPTFEVDGSTNNSAGFTLSGSNRSDIDFGFRGVGAIGDFVWLDSDADGKQDSDEPGLKDVDVILTFAGVDGDFSTSGDNLSITTTTNAAGAYSFAGLADGNYRIAVDTSDTDLPRSIVAIAGTQSISGTANVTLNASGRSVSDVDFGFAGTRTVGDKIWFDTDGDGSFDVGEPGIGSVDVNLVFAGQDGVFGTFDDVTKSTTTAADGSFTFANLPDGNYQVSVDSADLPVAVTATHDIDGTLDDRGDFSIGGTNRTDIDFGYRGARSLGDRFWYDADADGDQDAGEPGISGIDVTLTFAGKDNIFGSRDDLEFKTTTGTDGAYQFDHLPEGDFQVAYDSGDLLSGMAVRTSEKDDASGTLDGIANVGLGAVDRTDIDFGFTGSRTLGDFIFFDTNANGVIDVNEPGLGGVEVTLLFAGQDGLFGSADDMIRSTTSASDGAYEFKHLPNGNYRVSVDLGDLPTGLNQTYEGDSTQNNRFDVTINNANVSSADFGFTGSSSIGNTVWLDADADGVQDSGEPGLADITVDLKFAGADGVFGNSDDFGLQVVTDATGAYLFANLPAGSYRVAVDTTDSDLPDSLVAVSGTDSISGTANVSLATGQTKEDIDFGFAGTLLIGDRVWFDANGDSIQDAVNEPGLVGVTVDLLYAGQDRVFGTSDDISKTTTTGTNGVYGFRNLSDGDYRISVMSSTLPTGAVQTFDVDQSPFMTTLDHTARITLDEANRTEIDFGYRGSLSLGDTFFHDVNADGLQTSVEPGVAGIDVTATFAGADGAFGTLDDFELTTTTNSTGDYRFDSLFGGNYTVRFDVSDLPSGMTTATAEKDDSLFGPAVVDGSAEIRLTASRMDVNFGFTGGYSVGDRIWFDADGDGIQNAINEPGLADVEVILVFAGPNGVFGDLDDASLTTTTGADGRYQFSNLPDGNYRINYTASDLPANMVQTYEQDGTLDNRAEFSVSGSSRTDIDFGVQGNRTVGDSIWYDADGNGSQSAIEPGLAGIEVLLTFAGNDGKFSTTDDNFSLSTSTDANGNYNFASLPDGEYQLSVQVGDLPTGMMTITEETDDSALAHDGVSRISVNASRTDVDSGFKGTGVVGDSIFFDENGDGLQNGAEVGIPGVTVQVEVDYTGDGIADFTTTAVTDQNGKYSFTNLPEGSVTVSVTDPAGTNPTTDHDGDLTADSSNQVNLHAGSTDDSSDFGFIGSGTIGNTVYFDADGDGIQDDGTGIDPAEPGLPNVGVFLDIDFNHDGIVDRTLRSVTAAAGSYQFANLPAGDYTVRVTQPTGTSPTADADGIAGVSVNQSSLSLTSGQSNTNQNFGYKGTGSITDTVFFDIDNDEANEVGSGDRGIQNVDVTLSIDVNGDGTPDYAQTVQTDVNGDFTFTNLIPGQYTITTDSTDMRPGLAANPTVDNDGVSTAHSAEYSVSAGATATGPGFGFHATPDYDITKTGLFTVAKPGDTVQYMIVVKNVGELDGRNVAITDTFPKNVLQITDTDGGALNASTGTISWDIAALNPGQQQILTVTAVVRNPIADGLHDFTNSVSVTDDLYNGIDPDQTNNSSSWKAELDAEPDYAITKSNGVGVDSLAPGDRTTYTITVTNNGDQDGTGVVVIDRFPVDVFTLFDADSGVVDAFNGIITWNVGNLAAGETVILRPTFDLTTSAAAGKHNFTNHADVKDDGENGIDPTPGDNTTSDTDTLDAAPDYKITKWIPGSPASVLAGETVTYSILVENVGDQDGTGVIVTDTYPTIALTDVTAVGATIDPVNGTIIWNLGDLGGGGESVLLTVTATVRTDLPAGLHDLVNEAKVTDDLSNGTDPDSGNNVDTDVTFIGATPDLKIQKTDSDAEDVRPGETVWYTITYSNQGDQEATGIVITEMSPEGSVFNPSESTLGWTDQGDGTWTFHVGSLPTGSGGSITFAVTVNEILDPNREELMNTISIADDGSNGPDDNPADNVATDTTPLQVYTFDSFQDFSGNENDQNQYNDGVSIDRIQNRLAPLPVDTVYTGVVDPGTTLTGKIYDDHGRMIGEQTVVADSAGNWLMQFPTVVLSETPYQMQIQQTLSVQNDSFEAGFNLRRFFHPAVHSQVFMTSPLNVGSAFFHSPSNVLEAMHEANNNPLAFGWMNHPYELVISSTNVASM